MKPMARYVAELSCVVLCGALAISPSSLATPSNPGNPCTKDIERFCKDAKSKKGGVLGCLESHAKELTQACRDYEGPIGDGTSQDAKTKKTKFPYVYR